MKKINLLMSALALTSFMPVFGSDMVQTHGSDFRENRTSAVLMDTLNELKNALGTSDENFVDVSQTLNKALDMISNRTPAVKTLNEEWKKHIATLPAYVNNLLKNYDYNKEQSDFLRLKLLDIEVADKERVLAAVAVEDNMRWLAQEELNGAINVRAAFLSEMAKKHRDAQGKR